MSTLPQIAFGTIPLLAFVVACGGASPEAATPSAEVTTTVSSAPIPPPSPPAEAPPAPTVRMSETIVDTCKIDLTAKNAPKFGYNESRLGGSDSQALQQLSSCLLSGPLAGRKIVLVGRADPRGSHEYNMALGAERAKAVGTILRMAGVPSERIEQRSRGELDAEGTNEATWAHDRRVDVSLVD
ncbi:MAG: OmpA family protein [Deltaproteobacteria bacterium]|nr:OmpA family protein [Deltaproteobacteria bacterium]